MYGIPNCNTVKKASDWLKQHKLAFEFHNYKKEGISKKKLKEWCKHFGWENVLNKKGTTWQELSEEEKDQVTTEAAAIKFMMQNTSSIKRPIIEAGGKLLIRFNEEEYREALINK
jgi:Spx/MgsR family transcriptional regulator